MKNLILTFVFLWGLSPLLFGGQTPVVGLQPVPVAVDTIITNAIEAGVTPGAVLGVVRGNRLVSLKAYGKRGYGKRGQAPFDEPMTTDTVFDLASCSKVVATTTAVMMLVEQGKLSLEDPVDLYLPGFMGYHGEKILIKHLLTHTSGLPAYADVDLLVKNYGAGNKAGFLAYICTVTRDTAPGTAYRYSCLNFITLQHVVEKISGESLRDFTHRHIFARLGMSRTDYRPSVTPIAPTTRKPDGQSLCGTVHDQLAHIMNNGVSGNAGLFSCASDLAIFCSLLLNGGEWNGVRILQEKTVRDMLSVPAFAAPFGRTRGGWVCCAPDRDTFAGQNTSSAACGHTGYTGTCLLIDPERQQAIILLTNYIHPRDRHAVSEIRQLRRRVCEALTGM